MSEYMSVEDANHALPTVRRIVTDILAAQRELVDLIKEYGHLDAELDSLKARRDELEAQMRELTEQVNGFIDELEKLGGMFKGFEGVVDFYSTLDGRPVLLCWKLGEDRIEWWHEVGAGCAGRQRLPAHMLERKVPESEPEEAAQGGEAAEDSEREAEDLDS